jgi:hypothetical protein
MTDLAMMLEVFAAFLGSIGRIGDWVLYIFTADGDFMLHLIRYGILRLAGRASLAAAHCDYGKSG